MFQTLVRIVLIILIMLATFLWLIINASSHKVDFGSRIAPLMIIAILVVLFFLTKYLKKDTNKE